MENLKPDILKKISLKIKLAEGYFLEGDVDCALREYTQALTLIPHPKHSWKESWNLFYGISEMYFQYGDFKKALNYLEDCIKSPNGLGNPHVHLRIGQIRYELNQIDKAEDELMRAYMGAGLEIFKNEDEKYLNLIIGHIK